MTKNTGKGLSKAEIEEIAKQVAQGQCYYSHETVELLVQEVRRLRAWDDHLMCMYRESVDDNTRLEYEADWLAEQIAEAMNGGFDWETPNRPDIRGKEMWREAARRAVKNA